MSYRTFIQDFFEVMYDDTLYGFLFLVQSNKSAAVCRQSLILWTKYICTPFMHWITSNTNPKWGMFSLSMQAVKSLKSRFHSGVLCTQHSANPSWASVAENGSISPQRNHATCGQRGGRPKFNHGQTIADRKKSGVCNSANSLISLETELMVTPRS